MENLSEMVSVCIYQSKKQNWMFSSFQDISSITYKDFTTQVKHNIGIEAM